jgi:hypothetical protein
MRNSIERKVRRRRGEPPPEVEARPETHFRPHAFETDSKPTEQEYQTPCGSATSSTREEQLESIVNAPERSGLSRLVALSSSLCTI